MMDMKEDIMNDIVDDVMGAEEDEEERYVKIDLVILICLPRFNIL